MFKYPLAIFYSLIVFNFLSVALPVAQADTNNNANAICREGCNTLPQGQKGDCIQRCDSNVGNALKPGFGGAIQRLGAIGTQTGQTKSLEDVIGGIIQSALALVGVIFLALTVYGGYLWMLARENEEQAKKAMQIIKMAVIGLLIVLAAYAITYFVVARLTRATG